MMFSGLVINIFVVSLYILIKGMFFFIHKLFSYYMKAATHTGRKPHPIKTEKGEGTEERLDVGSSVCSNSQGHTRHSGWIQHLDLLQIWEGNFLFFYSLYFISYHDLQWIKVCFQIFHKLNFLGLWCSLALKTQLKFLCELNILFFYDLMFFLYS